MNQWKVEDSDEELLGQREAGVRHEELDEMSTAQRLKGSTKSLEGRLNLPQ